jgi:hypothetical protein
VHHGLRLLRQGVQRVEGVRGALSGDAVSLASDTPQAQAVCTWQVTAGTTVKPLVPIWIATTAYLVGEPVTKSNTVWRCTTAGTSGTTGPTGSAATSTDGGVTWTRVGPLDTAFKFGFVVVNVDTTSAVFYGTSPALTTVKASGALFKDGGSVALPASPALFYVVAGANAIVTVTACV